MALSLLPLFLLGALAALQALPVGIGLPLVFPILIFFGTYLVVLAAVLIGWLKGLPAWAYPYLAYGFIFALYLSFASTPGVSLFNIPMWGREMWGWRAFVPVALVVGAALLLRKPSWQRVSEWASEIWQDWTLLAYGLYGLLPLLVPILLDETGRSYRFPATALAMFVMLCGATLYLGMAKSRLRTALMLAGIFLCIIIASVGSSLYWETHDVDMKTFEHRPVEGPVPWGSVLIPSLWGSTIFTLILLLVPGLVGVAHWWAGRQKR
jgi:MFS family permease